MIQRASAASAYRNFSLVCGMSLLTGLLAGCRDPDFYGPQNPTDSWQFVESSEDLASYGQ